MACLWVGVVLLVVGGYGVRSALEPRHRWRHALVACAAVAESFYTSCASVVMTWEGKSLRAACCTKIQVTTTSSRVSYIVIKELKARFGARSLPAVVAGSEVAVGAKSISL